MPQNGGAQSAARYTTTYTSHSYDRMGNKLTQGEPYDPADSETYAYDSAYRLITFNRAPGGLVPSQSTWTLDGVGNIVQVNSVTQQYSSTNELIAQTNGSQTTDLAYDNDGNQTDDGRYLYTYDAMNRLTSVTLKSDGDLIAVYSYDALGRRIQKVVTNSGSLDGTTDYSYDGQQDIEEHDGAGALTQQYVYGGGINEVLVIDRNLNGDSTATGPGDQRLFYYQNALGSVYALTDTTAKILEAYQYDAFGYQTVIDPGPSGSVIFGSGDVVTPGGFSSLGNPYLFTGQRVDAETGLYQDRSRYQNPIQDRFITRDRLPLGTSAMTNLYAYADNNPTDLVDPLGLYSQAYQFKPTSTVGIGISSEVSYWCNEPPKVDNTEITGVNQVGFIISSEYKVNSVVDSFTKRTDGSCCCSGDRPGVPTGVRTSYEFTIRYFIYLKAGLGFGLGWGTGTLGWTSDPTEETATYTTNTICCCQGSK
ncbi:MAG: RHS repeat-associated core domain-containing protein [Isosphaeraceae bacterium]